MLAGQGLSWAPAEAASCLTVALPSPRTAPIHNSLCVLPGPAAQPLLIGPGADTWHQLGEEALSELCNGLQEKWGSRVLWRIGQTALGGTKLTLRETQMRQRGREALPFPQNVKSPRFFPNILLFFFWRPQLFKLNFCHLQPKRF